MKGHDLYSQLISNVECEAITEIDVDYKSRSTMIFEAMQMTCDVVIEIKVEC